MGTRSEVKMRDRLVALVLLAGSAAVLGVAQRNQGVMRDEATYFTAAEQYWRWFEELARAGPGQAMSRESLARGWSINNEHPVLFKTLSAMSWRFLHYTRGGRGSSGADGKRAGPPKSLKLLPEIGAFRVFGWLFTGLAVALIYLLGVRLQGRLAGLSAALLYFTVPRVFFHGQLCCFDSPIATMWLATVYAYLLSLERARWGLLAGIIFGLALATKHNAWFVPALLLIHYLAVIRPDVSLRPLTLPRIPLVFCAMAVLGPLVFVGHWPWLWFDTVAHIKGYFGFHLHHSYYNIEFLGENFGLPPLPVAYPFVMTLFTVPTVLLTLALAGLALYLSRPLRGALSRLSRGLVRPPRFDDRFRYPARRTWLRPGKGLDPRFGLLLALNALCPILIIANPSTPIFGGTKHWLTAYPFVALLAGVALDRLYGKLRVDLARFPQVVLGCALALLPALPGALGIVWTHPFGLSQYNALAGGVAGGADLGLNRQFWGYATRQILPWMNDTLPDDTRVYFHDTSYDSYMAYIRDGLLRPDIQYAGMELPAIETSDCALVIHELHFNKYDYWIWNAYQTAAPSRVLDLDGVPLVSAYQRPDDRGSP